MYCFIYHLSYLVKLAISKFKLFLSSVGATRRQDARLSEADLLEDGVPAHALQWDGLVRHLNQHGRSLLSLSAAAVAATPGHLAAATVAANPGRLAVPARLHLLGPHPPPLPGHHQATSQKSPVKRTHLKIW